MLSKQHRLPTKYDFAKVKRHGRVIHHPFCIISVLKRRDPSLREGPSRFGFVVSKKIDKRAVKRNRARRIFSEVIRLMLKNQNKAKPIIPLGYDVVFIIKKSALDKGYEEIHTVLDPVLPKIFVS